MIRELEIKMIKASLCLFLIAFLHSTLAEDAAVGNNTTTPTEIQTSADAVVQKEENKTKEVVSNNPETVKLDNTAKNETSSKNISRPSPRKNKTKKVKKFTKEGILPSQMQPLPGNDQKVPSVSSKGDPSPTESPPVEASQLKVRSLKNGKNKSRKRGKASKAKKVKNETKPEETLTTLPQEKSDATNDGAVTKPQSTERRKPNRSYRRRYRNSRRSRPSDKQLRSPDSYNYSPLFMNRWQKYPDYFNLYPQPKPYYYRSYQRRPPTDYDDPYPLVNYPYSQSSRNEFINPFYQRTRSQDDYSDVNNYPTLSRQRFPYYYRG